MSFLETLRSIGSVKPCLKCCEPDGSGRWPCGPGKYIDRENEDRMCPFCHGTGQICDAPKMSQEEMVSIILQLQKDLYVAQEDIIELRYKIENLENAPR